MRDKQIGTLKKQQKKQQQLYQSNTEWCMEGQRRGWMDE